MGLDTERSGKRAEPSLPFKLVCWPPSKECSPEQESSISLGRLSKEGSPQQAPAPCPLPRPALPLVPSPLAGAMHPLSSEVVKACLPDGQRKPFRHNMMALMTVTGAKGSVVNFSQVCFTIIFVSLFTCGGAACRIDGCTQPGSAFHSRPSLRSPRNRADLLPARPARAGGAARAADEQREDTALLCAL